ncbi:hypothetical protein Airi01_080930 [Actinoallomurus iriomotensis]|uniref:Uncharacterized protein n=1 Tax=Actinoallomurus iriomotensis TaxID=478107 RepID=A0A9W6RP16_9ACTN|nr:hypothetical protein Airi01_080930 [Actinoallomurus iriomotensis]
MRGLATGPVNVGGEPLVGLDLLKIKSYERLPLIAHRAMLDVPRELAHLKLTGPLPT